VRIFIIFILIIVTTNVYSENEAIFLVSNKCSKYTEDYFSKHKDRNKFRYVFTELGVRIDAYKNVAGVGKLESTILEPSQLFFLATEVMMECYPLRRLETSLENVEALLYRTHVQGKSIHGIIIKDETVIIYIDNTEE